jgi:hypothetical protein
MAFVTSLARLIRNPPDAPSSPGSQRSRTLAASVPKFPGSRREADSVAVPPAASASRYPAAHLVVAVIMPRKQAGKRRGRVGKPETARALLRDLISALGVTGAYTMTESDGLTGSTVQCAFENDFDAARFADAVRARRTGRHGGWESQSAFFLDEAASAAIRAVTENHRKLGKIDRSAKAPAGLNRRRRPAERHSP